MDRSLYVRYTVLLCTCILARIGSNCISFSRNFNTKIINKLIKFLAPLQGNFGVYANIDTKYISSTSNISFNFVVFNFQFLLFYFLIFSFLLSHFQVPLGSMRRLRAENLTPLDLEIEKTLRRFWRDKRAIS